MHTHLASNPPSISRVSYDENTVIEAHGQGQTVDVLLVSNVFDALTRETAQSEARCKNVHTQLVYQLESLSGSFQDIYWKV